jgi:multidrug efflux pump
MVFLPTGFLPSEDQGYFFVNVQLPDAAAFPRTQAVMEDVRSVLQSTPGVSDVISVSGFSLLSGAGSNVGLLIPVLKPWPERRPDQSVTALIGRLMPRFMTDPRATIAAFNPPPIPGLSRTGGFDFQLQAISEQSPQDLAATMRGLLIAANEDARLASVFSTFSASVPQVLVSVDRTIRSVPGRNLRDHAGTLGIAVRQ